MITPHLPCRILSEASSDCRLYFLFRYQTPPSHRNTQRTSSFPSKEEEEEEEERGAYTVISTQAQVES